MTYVFHSHVWNCTCDRVRGSLITTHTYDMNVYQGTVPSTKITHGTQTLLLPCCTRTRTLQRRSVLILPRQHTVLLSRTTIVADATRHYLYDSIYTTVASVTTGLVCSTASRSAHALSQLHVLSCILVLNFRAALYAFSGADNHDNLGSVRSPSAHIVLSTLRAMVNTFGVVTFPFLRLHCGFDKSPHCVRVTRR